MRRFVSLALLVMLAACGGDSTAPNADVTGNYTLRTVNGANPPTTIFQSSDETVELTGGNIMLNADKTWSGVLTVRVTDLTAGGTATTLSLPANGTYTSTGGTLTLIDATDGSHLNGSVGGGTLTISGDIIVPSVLTLVFKR